MAFFFGDGFDLYTALTDCGTYWDASFGSTVTLLISSSGRFAGSRGLTVSSTLSTTPYITKTSGSNDAVHHLCVAFQQTVALSGTTSGIYCTFYDGATAQCSVVFRSDGAILLTSGAVNGTTLATYTGAVAAINTWYQFEIEVVINNTTGSIAVRKNGNTSNDFSLGSLNTRASANNYANKVGLGDNWSTANAQTIDDFLWRSDTSSVAWVGDVRCYTRMPVSDVSVQWSRTGVATALTQTQSGGGSTNITNTVLQLMPYTCNFTGAIASVTLVTFASATGNMKAAIWADNAGVPGAVLASANPQATVAAGNNVFTLATPLGVVAGQKIWIGGIDDTSTGTWSTSGASGGGSATGTYAGFPPANPIISAAGKLASAITYAAPTSNAVLVGEPQQDAATTYVYSSTNGQADLYAIAPIANTPTTTIGVTTRGYMQKSDAGIRNATVQLKSSGTTVQGTSTALAAGSWGWIARNDLTDPATGVAWTATAVNNAQIGAVVTA